MSVRDLAKCGFVIITALSYTLLSGSSLNAQTPLPRLQQNDIQYVGAFRVPTGNFGGNRTDTLLNGGTALTFNPTNNSLFLVGNITEQLVSEISIPAVVNSTNLGSLNRATVIQGARDITEGRLRDVDPTSSEAVFIGGLLATNDKLYGTSYSYYDADTNAVLSHFSSGKTLSESGDFQGMHEVNHGVNIQGKAGLVAGQMVPVPSTWQNSLGGTALTGLCCTPISRRTSIGPAAFSFNLTNIGTVNPIPAKPLLYYTLDKPLRDNQIQSDVYNASTHITGMVFPVGSQTLLYFGRQGTGSVCYGDVTSNPALHNTTDSNGTSWCYDPADPYKGYHAYPYRYQVWAYDVADLVAVKNGSKNPWDVQPYGTWGLTLPFSNDGGKTIHGVAYDPNTQRIFVTQAYGDGDLPLVQVFKVNLASTPVASLPPTSPGNLTIR